MEALRPDPAAGFVAKHQAAYRDPIFSLYSSEESNLKTNPN